MAAKTLAQKLYIRPGYRVALLNAPKGAVELLAPLPDEVTLVTEIGDSESGSTKASAVKSKASSKEATSKEGAGKTGSSDPDQKIDLVICFVKNSAELEAQAEELHAALEKDVVLWFAYPKVSSKTASDLTRDKGWKSVYDIGFVGIASVAIDNVWSALRFKRQPAQTKGQMIAKLFAGERAVFLPLYSHLVDILSELGPEVIATPRQSYVAFARDKQFALLIPTKDRLDLVLRLPTAHVGGRLIPAPSLVSGSMTHRVPITNIADIDKDVLNWLGEAYRAANRVR